MKNRIVVALGVLVVLAVAAFLLTREDKPPEFKSPVDPIDPGELDVLEIVRPGEEGDRTKLAKVDGIWRVVEPVNAVADSRALENALEKIGGLEILDEASRAAENHVSLGVDEEHAVHVMAKRGEEVLLDVLIGELKGGFTMVRIPGNDTTYRVSGSIRHVFNKATKDWRDKVIFDFQAEDFARVEFHSPNGDWVFDRGEGDWLIEDAEIPDYDFHKVSSVVTSLARLRAMDFEDQKSPAEVGLGPESPTVRFRVKDDETAYVLRIGTSFAYNNSERFYVQREGVEQIYVISKYLADRFRPAVDRFQASKTGRARKQGAGARDEERRARTDAGPTKLPPEVMRQVERELEKQKRMKALMEGR